MDKYKVVNYFGGVRATARALEYSASYVSGWPSTLPNNVQHRVQVFTDGYFMSVDNGRATNRCKLQENV